MATAAAEQPQPPSLLHDADVGIAGSGEQLARTPSHVINPIFVMNETVTMGGSATGVAQRRVRFETYHGELQMARIKALMDQDLSEPYSVFTYRYFINNWPHLCILAIDVDAEESCARQRQPPQQTDQEQAQPQAQPALDPIVGAVVCKCDEHKSHFTGTSMRGYIAMLAVDPRMRKLGIGSELVQRAIRVMVEQHDCQEVALETETINKGALRLYENLGFVKDKRLGMYYLNGGDAFRLVLRLP